MGSQNMHEIACISGIAAAYQPGATYEPFDDFAEDFFAKYLLVCHGTRYKRQKEKDTQPRNIFMRSPSKYISEAFYLMVGLVG